jgi:tetratricopeptide (TPR) repeat protein
LIARWFAEWRPENFESRWSIADELMAFAGDACDRETTLLCRLFFVTCLIERGETNEFERQLSVFEEAAEVIRQPEAIWYSTLLKATYALHVGRISEADQLSRRFAEFGELIRDANVFHSRTTHRVLIAHEMARYDEMVGAASEGSDRYPAMYGWKAARIWALLLSDRVSEGRREFDILCRDGIASIPRRMDWTVTMAMLSESASRLRDRERCLELLKLFEPLRGRMIVLGLCVVTWGCASRFLAKLAAALGQYDQAERFFDEAIAREDEAGARVWAAWSRLELGQLLLSRPTGGLGRSRAARLIEEARSANSALGLTGLGNALERIS